MPPKSTPKEKEASKSTPKEASKSTTKTASKSTAKTASKSTAKADSKSTTKTASKSTTKAPSKSTTKAVSKSATKATSKSTTKTAKSTTKTASKSTTKAVAKKTAKSGAKTVGKTAGKAKSNAKKTTTTAKDKQPVTAKASKKQPPKKRTLAVKTSTGEALKKGKAATKPAEKKVEKKKKVKSVHIEARPKKFHVGGDLKPNRNIGRMVKWPAYIRLQRRKKIMLERLKVPAQIHQFSETLEKHSALELFRLIKKYRPESEYQRKRRLLQLAKAKKEGKAVGTDKPFVVKFGANHVTTLVEQKKAKLVVIANDVDPIEHVLYLPTLCHKLEIPYVIVKNKARLGTAVHMKTCAALAFVNIKNEDKGDFNKIVTLAKENYNDKRDHILRTVGGGKLGLRSSTMLKKRKEALDKAQAARANLI